MQNNYQNHRGNVQIVEIGWTPVGQCPQNEYYIIRTISVLKGRTPEGKIIDLLNKGR